MSYRNIRGREVREPNNYKNDFLPQDSSGNEGVFSGGEDVDDSPSSVRLPDIKRDNRFKRNAIGKRPDLGSRIPVAKNPNSSRNVGEDDVENPLVPGDGDRFRSRSYPGSSTSGLQGKGLVYSSSYSDSSSPRESRKNPKFHAAKKVIFYRNGDRHFHGVKFVITRQRYRSFNSLVEELSKAIPLPYGVRYIFSSDGQVISDISQLEDGKCYICSSGDQFVRNIDYSESVRNQKRNGLENYSSSNSSLQDLRDSTTKAIKSLPNENLKPRVITIITGTVTDKNKKCKILLNRKTVKSYEHVLNDISEMLKLSDGPVRELYTLQGIKIGGLAELFRGSDTFMAVSEEQRFKRNLSNPSSLSSNGEISSPMNKIRLPKSRKKPRKEQTRRMSGVAINVNGQSLMYYPPSEYDMYTIDSAPVNPPDSKLQLQWVYGYHGKDAQDNVHVLPSGEMLYYVATVAVIFNKSNRTQRHYTGHAEDIQCLVVHPNQWYVATGQISGLSLDQNEMSHIRIWDAETLITLAVLSLDDYNLGVVCLAFSYEDNGRQLACVDAMGKDYKMTVWEWESRAVAARSKVQSSSVVAVAFDPDDSRTIISCGKEHVHFWRLHNNKLERKSGYFEKYEVPQFFTCLEFAPNGDVITGDSSGGIIVWSKVSKKIKFTVRNAHEKSILCLRMLEDGTLLTGGGVDGRLAAWDANKYFASPQQEVQLEEGHGGVSAIEPVHTGLADDVTLLLGTTSNHILEGSFTVQFVPLVKSHDKEIQAVAVHPTNQLFITGSLDKTATLWSAESHIIVWTVNVEFPVRSAAVYISGSVVALGTTIGRWIVLNAETGVHVASFQDGDRALTDLKYSQDGEHIAVASEDGKIYVHSVYDDGVTYRRVGCCASHASAVSFLDWSGDGCFIQSVTSEYQHIVWEIGGFEREESKNVIRDTEWATRNVMLGYDIAGVWPLGDSEGNLVTSSDLSKSLDLFAVGDELGYVRLFRYPCSQPGAQYYQSRGHGSSVSRMNFLPSDTCLLTTGGNDACVMQWSIHSKLAPLAEESEEEYEETSEHESPHSDEQEVDEQRSSYEYESSPDAVRATARPKRPGDEYGFHGDKFADDVDRKRQGGGRAQLEPKQRTISKVEEPQDEKGMFPVRRIPRHKHRQSYDSYAKQYQTGSRNALQGNGNISIENAGVGYQNESRPEVSMSNEQYSDDEKDSDDRRTGDNSRYHGIDHVHRNKHRGGRIRR